MRITVDIDGMSCENCVKHARDALEGLKGVSGVTVSLADNSAVFEAEADPGDDAIRQALDEEGYETKGIARA